MSCLCFRTAKHARVQQNAEYRMLHLSWHKEQFCLKTVKGSHWMHDQRNLSQNHSFLEVKCQLGTIPDGI